MRADRHPHIFEDAVVFLDQAVVDRHARIIDDLVDDAERVLLRDPAIIVDRLRPIFFAAGVELVDRDDLARLRLGQQIVVLEAPPRRSIAAKGLALVIGVERAARPDVDNADFEDVAGFGAADRDRTGADVHAKAFAGAAPKDRRVHRPGAAAVDVLFVLRPQKHAFGAGVAFDHALVIVIGMMRQRLDRDVVAGIDLDQRL